MPRKASLSVIERKIAELQKKVEEIKSAAKPGIKQLKAVLTRFKLSHADLFGVFGGGNSRPARHKLKGVKVAPKYRNPSNRSETWTGRGLQPKWMTAAIKEKGLRKENFLIAKAPKVKRKAARKSAN